VPRPTSSDRLDAIVEAATRVFGRNGYRRTRTADVAAEAGISAGGLFTYVDSKEALFHLVFLAGFGRLDEARLSLPLRTPTTSETLELIGKGLASEMACPALAAAARRDAPGDAPAELTAIIEEQFRGQSRNWQLLAVIERSAADLPELEDMYFTRGRRGRIRLLERYLTQRIADGQLRDTVDTTVAARWLIETVTWFAWKRRGDRDAALYDDEPTLAAITNLMCDALIAPSS
jgi:AcrR family transcriptional regulator